MGHVLTAQHGADLHGMVELALEGAGYSVAALVESNLTVELLESKSNPVVVLLNKQASQCILVDVITQSHPTPSLSTAHISSVWGQSDQRLRSFAVDRYSGMALEDDLFATRPLGLVAWASSSRLGSQPGVKTYRPEHRAERIRRIWRSFTHTRVRATVAVMHFVVLALLGCFSGLFLRSWWAVVLIPVVYISGVALMLLGAPPATLAQ